MALPNNLDLTQFTGTEGYHRWSPLFRNVVASDGVIYLAEQAGAYWLLDVIGSHMPSVPKDEGFCVVTFGIAGKDKKDGWLFSLVDDIPANKVYATQHIECSDFPLDEIKLYVGRQENFWVIMLPSEY